MSGDKWKEDVIALLTCKVKPDYILLFGSFAKGIARAESDVDLAYSSSKKLSDYERFMLAQELANLVSREVDLIDLRQADTVFAAQIYYDGEPLYCRDEEALVKDRMKALSMYATLNEQRKVVLDSIKERGSVYGE